MASLRILGGFILANRLSRGLLEGKGPRLRIRESTAKGSLKPLEHPSLHSRILLFHAGNLQRPTGKSRLHLPLASQPNEPLTCGSTSERV